MDELLVESIDPRFARDEERKTILHNGLKVNPLNLNNSTVKGVT